MEELSVPKDVPVPAPYFTGSFLAKANDILTVTPEKTLSAKLRPITQTLKEGSFLDDEKGKNGKAKVQFNRSVSVFHFPCDQTSNEDENSRESIGDEFSFDRCHNSYTFSPSEICKGLSGPNEMQHLTNKVEQIETEVRQNYSKSCQPSYSQLSSSYKNYLLTEGIHSDYLPGLGSIPIHGTPPDEDRCTPSIQDSPIITDVHSFGDEMTWEDDDDVGSDEVSKYPGILSSCIKSVGGADSAGRHSTDVKSESSTDDSDSDGGAQEIAETSHGKLELTRANDVRSKPNKSCLKNLDFGPCLLTQPTINSTLRVSAELEKLKEQSFETKILQKGKLKDSKMQAKINEKALGKLNASETNWFSNLTDIRVDEEELCRKVNERMPKVRRKKATRVEDKISRMPHTMDFYNEKYFVTEMLSRSVHSFALPHSHSFTPCSSSANNKQSFKPRLKTVGPQKALSLYKNVRLWEGLPP